MFRSLLHLVLIFKLLYTELSFVSYQKENLCESSNSTFRSQRENEQPKSSLKAPLTLVPQICCSKFNIFAKLHEYGSHS